MKLTISALNTLLLIGFLICTHASAQQLPAFGISPNVREGGTFDELVAEIKALKQAGCRAMYSSFKWSELEPKAGEINLKPIDDAVRGLGGLGFDLAITIQTLDTNNRTLPPDLKELPFDSPVMRDRFGALLKAITPKLNGKVRWLMLGNEVDVYLGEHPAELEPYAGFIERGRKLLREARPDLLVGVTNTFDGLAQRKPVFDRLNREMDVISLTYYPLGAQFMVKPLLFVPGHIRQMVEACGKRPMILQEAGYPADPLLGSSEEKQAEFVDRVFEAAKEHGSTIQFVNFFLLVDFNNQLVETFLKYYGIPDAHFRAYLASLGFKKADGTPRKAYGRFLERLKGWK